MSHVATLRTPFLLPDAVRGECDFLRSQFAILAVGQELCRSFFVGFRFHVLSSLDVCGVRPLSADGFGTPSVIGPQPS